MYMADKMTLSDQIYTDLKKEISARNLISGEKINIKELARRYGVSDTPVKQALQRLADEKLVVNTPNKGMRVRSLTPHELGDIFDIRLMMDTFFARDIVTALNYNSKLREQIVANQEEQRAFLENQQSDTSPEEYFRLDLQFHVLLLTASGNQKAVEILKYMQPFTFCSGAYLTQPHHRDCECVEEHEAILKAAFAGDVEGMKQAMITHIQNSRRAFQLIFNINQMV